jgi:hypothetical protein
VDPIAFTSKLEPADLVRVGVVTSLLNPLSLTAMGSGPVLWLAGKAAGGGAVSDFGLSLMFLIVAVPIAGLFAAAYAAYRPGAAELFSPVAWVFSDAGVELTVGEDVSFAAWDEFMGFRRLAGCYLLHTSTRNYVVLPASGVPDRRAEDFDALLSEKLRSLR